MRAPILVLMILLAGCNSDEKALKRAELAKRMEAHQVLGDQRVAAGATVMSTTDIPGGRITTLSVPTGSDGVFVDYRKCVLFTGEAGAAIDCRDEDQQYVEDDSALPSDDGENQFGRY